MNHPLKPTLYDDPVVVMAYDQWDRFYIWLHKQPLFLWQIALSFKLFGISEFSLRIPNIVLGTALVFCGYRSGKLLVNSRTGFITGVLMVTSLYFLELVAGRQGLEHNDFSFLVYVSLSIWSFLEYHYSKNKIWILFIGLFSGGAILCKWLVGLLVYSGWFTLRVIEKKFSLSQNIDLLISVAITAIVSVPWQVLTFIWYPHEAQLAYKFNVLHFSEPLEGHTGTFWYHFSKFNLIYGEIAPFLIVPAFVVLYKQISNRKLFFPLVTMVFLTYLFFSITATKMPSFTIVTALIILIALATLVDYLLKYLQNLMYIKSYPKSLFVFTLLIFVLLKFDIEQLQKKHTLWQKENVYSQMLMHNKAIFTSLNLPPNAVLFNVKGRHYIEAMFYMDNSAYHFVPSENQYLDLKEKGRIVAIFNPVKGEIPDYLLADPTTIVIDKVLSGFN